MEEIINNIVYWRGSFHFDNYYYWDYLSNTLESVEGFRSAHRRKVKYFNSLL